ncbi:MAG: hypothetical protein ACREUO_11590 [Burkholderiales bacterium]
MDEAKRKRWWRAGGLALLALSSAIAFSAYLRPDMLVAFGDLMAFCASLIR